MRKKRVHRAEETDLIEMMNQMADGKHDVMWAIKIRAALRAGVDMNLTDKNGETPLMLAVKMHNYFIVDELIQAGVRTDIRDNQHRLVMWHAVKTARPAQDEIIKGLLRVKAPVDADCVAAALEKDGEMAFILLQEAVRCRDDMARLRELAEHLSMNMSAENIDKNKAIINTIFELTDNAVLSEDKAVEILTGNAGARRIGRSEKPLPPDPSRQHN